MKNKCFFLLILLLVGGLLSCSKDDLDKYTIVTTVIDTGGTVNPAIIQVDKGYSLVLDIKPYFGFEEDSIFVNGQGFLLTEGGYALDNVSSNLKIEVKFKKTAIWGWGLMNIEWKNDSIYILGKDGMWQKSKLWGVPGEVQERITFLSDGKLLIYWDDKVVGEDDMWDPDETVSPPTVRVLGTVWKIEKLSSNKLILSTDDMQDAPWVENPSMNRSVKQVYFK